MVKEEIEVEVIGVDLDARLASEEGEAVAEFEQEGFHLAKDGVFEALFEVAILEPEEVEDVGIANDEGGRKLVVAAQRGELGADDFLGFPKMAVHS